MTTAPDEQGLQALINELLRRQMPYSGDALGQGGPMGGVPSAQPVDAMPEMAAPAPMAADPPLSMRGIRVGQRSY